MLDYLYDHLWATLGSLLTLHLTDYGLTIAGARRYRAQKHYQVEGSYELNPRWEKDVNALRRFSPKYLLMLALAMLFYTVVWFWLHAAPGDHLRYHSATSKPSNDSYLNSLSG